MNDVLKRHLLTICCAVSIIALFLPFASCNIEMNILGESGADSQSMSGFIVMQEYSLAYVLLAGPILLIAMNYIKQLDQHKALLSIAVPAICLIACVVTFLSVKSIYASSIGVSEDFGVNIKIKIGFGAILAILSYIGTAVGGAVTYHNYTLDKNGLERLRQESSQLLQSAQQKISEVAQNAQNSEQAQPTGVQTPSTSAQATSTNVTPPIKAKPIAKKPTNLSRTDEVLAMIEKLSKMKEAGVLTEEEFNEKKKQMLSEI